MLLVNFMRTRDYAEYPFAFPGLTVATGATIYPPNFYLESSTASIESQLVQYLKGCPWAQRTEYLLLDTMESGKEHPLSLATPSLVEVVKSMFPFAKVGVWNCPESQMPWQDSAKPWNQGKLVQRTLELSDFACPQAYQHRPETAAEAQASVGSIVRDAREVSGGLPILLSLSPQLGSWHPRTPQNDPAPLGVRANLHARISAAIELADDLGIEAVGVWSDLMFWSTTEPALRAWVAAAAGQGVPT